MILIKKEIKFKINLKFTTKIVTHIHSCISSSNCFILNNTTHNFYVINFTCGISMVEPSVCKNLIQDSPWVILYFLIVILQVGKINKRFFNFYCITLFYRKKYKL